MPIVEEITEFLSDNRISFKVKKAENISEDDTIDLTDFKGYHIQLGYFSKKPYMVLNHWDPINGILTEGELRFNLSLLKNDILKLTSKV